MKTTHARCCIVLMTAITAHAIGGELDPAPGAIAPTMKSLDQIEPRVCINELPGDAGAVRVIDQPGNFYLTADIIGEPGKHGIRIDSTAEGAYTIDLNGFSLIGVAGSLDAVHGNDNTGHEEWIQLDSINQGASRGGSVINGWGDDGVEFTGFDNVQINGVNIANNADNGVVVADAIKLTLVGCSASDNGGNGIVVLNAEICDAITIRVSGNSVDGVHVFECDSVLFGPVDASGNGGAGIRIAKGKVVKFKAGKDLAKKVNAIDNGGGGGPAGGVIIDGAAYVEIDGLDTRTNIGPGLQILDIGEVHGEDSREYDITGVSATGNTGHGVQISLSPGEPVQGININIGGVVVSSNGDDGVYINTAPGEPVKGINIVIGQEVGMTNGGNGCEIDIDSGLAPSVIHLSDSTFDHNDFAGISVISDADGDQSIEFENVNAASNGAEGFLIVDPSPAPAAKKKTKVSRSTASSNGADGMSITFQEIKWEYSGSVDNSGDGFEFSGESCIIDHCEANGNVGNGVFFQDVDRNSGLDRVTANGNGGSGIAFTGAAGVVCGSARLSNCITSGNLLNGVDFACTTGGTIRACEASNNGGGGFVVGGFGHVVIENIASGNALGGYSVPIPGNSVGPVVDELGLATNTNPHANLVR